MNYLSVLREMSQTVRKTRTNPHTRNQNPLRVLPESVEAVRDDFPLPSPELILDKYLTQKVPDDTPRGLSLSDQLTLELIC